MGSQHKNYYWEIHLFKIIGTKALKSGVYFILTEYLNLDCHTQWLQSHRKQDQTLYIFVV